MFKVNNKITRTTQPWRSDTGSKSGVASFLVFLLFTLNKQMLTGK